MGALLNANVVYKKSQDMRSIMDNLSFTMEDVSRNVRTGYNYQCVDNNVTSLNTFLSYAGENKKNSKKIAFLSPKLHQAPLVFQKEEGESTFYKLEKFISFSLFNKAIAQVLEGGEGNPFLGIDQKIDIPNIDGVTVPVAGGTPVSNITPNVEYSGTVTWTPIDNPFNSNTNYAAIISINPNPGYTLTGVSQDFFTVNGATSVKNDQDSGIVRAVFPVTGSSFVPPPDYVYTPYDCTTGWGLVFRSNDGDQVIYYISNGKFFKAINGLSNAVQMTSDEIDINPNKSGFSVMGSELPPNAKQQPFTVFRLSGTITYGGNITPFSIQTSVSQRLLNF